MKNIIKQLIFLSKIFFYLPLLIIFWLTTEKKIIMADVQRWAEALGWERQNHLLNLLALLQDAPEFRNIYYHRIFKGNFKAKVVMYMLRIFYRPCPYFFLDNSSNIGAGLFIQHGFSTIIMADMGENCWVNQQVTIGYKDKTGRPHIGNNVRITAGAKVIGKIKIGDNVTVGANAVVVKNVPDNCVVVGVPAYIIQKNGIKVKEELV